MQFLYYKNKIIDILNGTLPKSVFVWYVILGVCILVITLATAALYYDAYKVYTGQSVQSDSREEYEPVLDLSGLDEIVGLVR